ncbi:MAG: MCE-family protein [Mycobacterium sp.]|nr:MCE-family protein [Mycobacterium sp.]
MITVPEDGQVDVADEAAPNDPKEPPYRAAGTVLVVIVALVFGMTWALFRGYFDSDVTVVLMAERAGLSMDPGSKVTFNGVPIGRLKSAGVVSDGRGTRARLVLDVEPQYLTLVPANVDAQLRATTVFGNKYISFLSPANPTAERLRPDAVIEASATTTEFNTVFETIMGIAQQVDPVKLNQTLTAAAQALNGLGDSFGRAVIDGHDILGELNPRSMTSWVNSTRACRRSGGTRRVWPILPRHMPTPQGHSSTDSTTPRSAHARSTPNGARSTRP